MTGRFFVLEGLDGAGTTTQAQRLTAWLRSLGRAVLPTFEPSDGPVGRLIRATLRHREGAPAPTTLPWMFAADRADHLAREIEPALGQQDVVCDRYVPSSLAYQSLSLPYDRVYALNADFRVPDLTLFLRLDPDTALARIEARGGDRELFEHRDRLLRVAAAYDAVFTDLAAKGVPLVHVDAAAPVEVVEQAVRDAVRAFL